MHEMTDQAARGRRGHRLLVTGRMGGTLVEMRQDPETLANPDTWAVMQDPEGNEFCVFDVHSVTGLA
jgi:hypothetical protein